MLIGYVKIGFIPVANFHIKGIYIYLIVPALYILLLFLSNAYRLDRPYWDKGKVISLKV